MSCITLLFDFECRSFVRWTFVFFCARLCIRTSVRTHSQSTKLFSYFVFFRLLLKTQTSILWLLLCLSFFPFSILNYVNLICTCTVEYVQLTNSIVIIVRLNSIHLPICRCNKHSLQNCLCTGKGSPYFILNGVIYLWLMRHRAKNISCFFLCFKNITIFVHCPRWRNDFYYFFLNEIMNWFPVAGVLMSILKLLLTRLKPKRKICKNM